MDPLTSKELLLLALVYVFIYLCSSFFSETLDAHPLRPPLRSPLVEENALSSAAELAAELALDAPELAPAPGAELLKFGSNLDSQGSNVKRSPFASLGAGSSQLGGPKNCRWSL